MKLPTISGKQAINRLTKICFKHIRTKGSHAILYRINIGKITIPLHEELSKGVIVAIMRYLEKLGYKRRDAIKFLKSGKPRKVACPLFQ